MSHVSIESLCTRTHRSSAVEQHRPGTVRRSPRLSLLDHGRAAKGPELISTTPTTWAPMLFSLFSFRSSNSRARDMGFEVAGFGSLYATYALSKPSIELGSWVGSEVMRLGLRIVCPFTRPQRVVLYIPTCCLRKLHSPARCCATSQLSGN